MVGRVGGHRADDGHLVRHLSDVRKHVRQPEPALAALLERKVAAPQQADLPEENVRLLAGAKRLAVGLVQPGLVVVRVDVAHAADEADVDRPLSPGREVRERRLAKRRRPGGGITRHQASKRRGADASDAPVEKLSSIQCAQVVHIS